MELAVRRRMTMAEPALGSRLEDPVAHAVRKQENPAPGGPRRLDDRLQIGEKAHRMET